MKKASLLCGVVVVVVAACRTAGRPVDVQRNMMLHGRNPAQETDHAREGNKDCAEGSHPQDTSNSVRPCGRR